MLPRERFSDLRMINRTGAQINLTYHYVQHSILIPQKACETSKTVVV